MENLKETDLAYMAGLLDGEGCIEIAKQLRPLQKYGTKVYYYIRVRIGNTVPSLIKFCNKRFGGKIWSGYKKNSTVKFYNWTIFSNQAVELLKLILPYLISKREEALLALEFQKTQYMGRKQSKEVLNQKEEMFLKMKFLKTNLKIKRIIQ